MLLCHIVFLALSVCVASLPANTRPSTKSVKSSASPAKTAPVRPKIQPAPQTDAAKSTPEGAKQDDSGVAKAKTQEAKSAYMLAERKQSEEAQDSARAQRDKNAARASLQRSTDERNWINSQTQERKADTSRAVEERRRLEAQERVSDSRLTAERRTLEQQRIANQDKERELFLERQRSIQKDNQILSDQARNLNANLNNARRSLASQQGQLKALNRSSISQLNVNNALSNVDTTGFSNVGLGTPEGGSFLSSTVGSINLADIIRVIGQPKNGGFFSEGQLRRLDDAQIASLAALGMVRPSDLKRLHAEGRARAVLTAVP